MFLKLNMLFSTGICCCFLFVFLFIVVVVVLGGGQQTSCLVAKQAVHRYWLVLTSVSIITCR